MRALIALVAVLALPATRGSSSAVCASPRAVLVTGGNKGQGFALCERVLAEHPDAHVFLGARNRAKGEEAVARLEARAPGRVELVELDVTDDASVRAAHAHVAARLGGRAELHGIVSNAGILWGHSLHELVEVCTLGVQRVVDAFVPLLRADGGRVVVVSSGMGPLLHGYASAERRAAMADPSLTWSQLRAMIDECLAVERAGGEGEEFEAIGFGGGPFSELPYFHKYGLAKMFADVYMQTLARMHPQLVVNSCDPGLVFTDLAKEVPRFKDKTREEAGAATPAEGVEAAMRLLFADVGAGAEVRGSGEFYAMSKDRSALLRSTIDQKPAAPAASG